jgi:hypothetical protein
MSKRLVEPEATDDNLMQHMRFVCWIGKATHTHTHTLRICNTYCVSRPTVVLKRVPIIRYTYTSCIVLVVAPFSKVVSFITQSDTVTPFVIFKHYILLVLGSKYFVIIYIGLSRYKELK